MDEARVIRILGGDDRSAFARLARAGLGAVTPGYRAAVAARNRLFDRGLRKPHHLGRPTVSVGNLTTGGTGKTPMVIHLARRLVAMGHRPAVLMRGYRGHQLHWGPLADEIKDTPPPRFNLSDEQLEYRHALPDLPVAADPDRVRSARFLLQTSPQIGAFLLDDGFQHRQVHRDLDLVLIDATRPFGFGRLLPRGLLREPAANLRRADAAIVTRVDQVSEDELADLDDRIVALTDRPPLAHAAMRWGGFRTTDGEAPTDTLRPLRVVGVCGIGNPDAFHATLARHAAEVADLLTFPDHHDYAVDDWRRMLDAMNATGSDALVTTEKDWVKLHRFAGASDGVRVLRPIVRVAFTHGEAAVDALLRKMVGDTHDRSRDALGLSDPDRGVVPPGDGAA